MPQERFHQATSLPGGFSLVELAVVLATLAILSALAYESLGGLRARAESRNGVREIEALLRRARSEAFARGASVVFFLHPAASGGTEFGAVVDNAGTFDPANIDASIGPADVVLDRQPVPPGVFFRDPTSPVLAQPLPAPFDHLPANTPCTFCDTPGALVVVFRSDGTAALGVNPAAHPMGGAFSLVAVDPDQGLTADDGKSLDHETIAVLSRTGTIASFDR